MTKALESDNAVAAVADNGEILTTQEVMSDAQEQPELHTGKPDVGDGQGALPHGDISQGEPTTVETVVDLSSL